MSFQNSLNGNLASPSPLRNGIPGPSSTKHKSAFAQITRPSVPTAKELFEPQIKVVLRRRLVRVFALSALVATISAAVSNYGFQGEWGSWTLFTLLKATVWLVVGMIPTIVARKQWMQAYDRPGVYPSFKSHLMATLKDKQTTNTILIYTVSSLSLSVYALPGFLAPTRRHPYSINPKLVLYLSASLSVAVWQGARESLRGRYRAQWAKYANSAAALSTIKTTLPYNLVGAIAGAVIQLAIFMAVYHSVLPAVIKLLYKLPFSPFLFALNRSVASALPYPLSVPLLFTRNLWKEGRTLCMFAIRNSLIWESTNTLVDIYLTQLPTQLGSDDKAISSIIGGLSSDNEFFGQHAYNILGELVSSSEGVRKIVYGDLKYSPSMWASIVQATLGEKALGGDKGLLQRRGAAPPSAPKPVAAPKPAATIPGTPKKLERGSIFKPVQASPRQRFIDETLSSEGSAAKLLVNATDSISKVPSLFLAQTGEASAIVASKAPAKPAPAPSGNIVTKVVASARGQVSRILVTPRWLKESGIQEYWSGERKERAVRGWVRKVEKDLRAIQVLRTLVVHSLQEDSLGTVQSDIPKVLEAFCTYSTVVEEAKAELLSTLKPEATRAQRGEMVKAMDVLYPLDMALGDATLAIVDTFRERLGVYQFAPKTARRLQLIADQL